MKTQMVLNIVKKLSGISNRAKYYDTLSLPLGLVKISVTNLAWNQNCDK